MAPSLRSILVVSVGTLLSLACGDSGDDSRATADTSASVDTSAAVDTTDSADTLAADTAVLDTEAPGDTTGSADTASATDVTDDAMDTGASDTSTVADTTPSVPHCAGTIPTPCEYVASAATCGDFAGCSVAPQDGCSDDDGAAADAPWQCSAMTGNAVFCTATDQLDAAGWHCTYIADGQCVPRDKCRESFSTQAACAGGLGTSQGTLPCYWGPYCEGTFELACATVAPTQQQCESIPTSVGDCTWVEP